MAAFAEGLCSFFGIEKLHPHQVDAISALLNERDVFLACQTGGGKSLCYQGFPVALKSVKDSGSSENECEHADNGVIVIVITPLISIMKEQVEILNALGFKATYIGRDDTEQASLLDGHFDFIFGSPESIVGNERWRGMIRSPVYQEKLKLLVTDEAHTVVDWYV